MNMDMTITEILKRIFLTKFSIGEITLPFTLLRLLLQFVLPLVVIFFVFKIIKKGLTILIMRSKARDENKKNAVTWIRRGFNIIYYILFFIFISSLLGAETMKYLQMIFDVLNQPLVESGGTRITIITIILTIPVFYIGSWIGRTVKKMVNTAVLERLGFDDSRKFSFTSIIQYGIMIIVVLIGLSIIGIDLSALTLIFGVMGIGLGFGLQSVVANMIAGLIIIFSRPVKEGDRVLINGLEGTVTHIRLNSTSITTLTNESIIVPNSNFTQNIVHNYSYDDKKIVIVNTVSISYDNDPSEACALLEKIAAENMYSLKYPAPVARFKNFGDSGLELHLHTWIDDLKDKYDAHEQINREIWKRFRENNISIPFPHVHLVIPKENPPMDVRVKMDKPEPGKPSKPPVNPEVRFTDED